MSDPRRAIIFGEYAASYDRHRPHYPPEAIARLLSLVDMTRAVEIGAGTGLATQAIARDDLELICLEPSPGMAAVLAGKRLPGVEVVISAFEDWEGAIAHFDLVYAAQAWHWVDRATGYGKARSILRPGGALALMWNIPVDRYAGYEEVYEAQAPQLLADQDERIERRDTHDWAADLAEAGFREVQVFGHTWAEDLSAAGLRALYSTYSDHMLLPEPTRTGLLAGLEAIVEGRGGVATVQYRTELTSGLV